MQVQPLKTQLADTKSQQQAATDFWSRARAPSLARSLPTQAGEEAIVDRSVVGESVYHSEIEHAAANLGNPVMSLRGTTRDCRWDGVGGHPPLSVSSTIV